MVCFWSMVRTLLVSLAIANSLCAQSDRVRVIAFGAHPDDCDIRASGTAALFAKLGNAVKFVSVTNGDAGHQTMGPVELARRRLAEAKESARRLGIEYDVLNNHDGKLLPTLDVREQVIREIRQWNADIVLAPRPNDYHPDHRYTGVLVQDAAYMVVVPHIVPDVLPLRKNPVFLYYEDGFQRPNPFRPDIAIAIDEVIDRKIDALDAHVSQVYEWLPWVDGKLNEVPRDAVERKAWLKRARTRMISPVVRQSLVKWYGAERGNAVKYYEAFEICEYGAQPDSERIRHLFPMLPTNGQSTGSLLLNPDAPEMNRKAPDVFRVRLDTNKGSMLLALHRDWAPNGVDRFYDLVRGGYYDGDRFFRVIKNRWAQFGIHGDPKISNVWRSRTIPDDPRRGSNVRGTLAYAFAVPNGRTTQVFINLRDNSATHDREPFVPIGKVLEGMEVADALNSEYGESSGSGIRAGKQGPLFEGGNEYLALHFPRLDWIERALVIER